MTSPTLMNSGTLIVAPVEIFAGLVAPVAVSPRKPGLGLDTTVCSMKFGSETPTARPLKNSTSTLMFSGMKSAESPMVSFGMLHLIVGRRVHEDERVGVRVQVLHRLRLDVRRLQLVARAQVALQHRAGQQVLHLGARERRALPRLDELELDDGVRRAVDHDLQALADVGRVVHGDAGLARPSHQRQGALPNVDHAAPHANPLPASRGADGPTAPRCPCGRRRRRGGRRRRARWSTPRRRRCPRWRSCGGAGPG